MLGMLVLGLILVLAPYTGPALSGSVPGTAKFLVAVSGRPGEPVRLRALGVPRGYIASFCTNLVCAPFSVGFDLPANGREQIELQLIANDPGARHPRTVIVTGNGARASIPFWRAAH